MDDIEAEKAQETLQTWRGRQADAERKGDGFVAAMYANAIAILERNMSAAPGRGGRVSDV